MNGRVVWLQRVDDQDLESFASDTIAEVRSLVLGAQELKPQSTDVGRGLDERWNALHEPRNASDVVPEVSAANEDVDARVLDPIPDPGSHDCFFGDHPLARRRDAILSALSLAENMQPCTGLDE